MEIINDVCTEFNQYFYAFLFTYFYNKVEQKINLKKIILTKKKIHKHVISNKNNKEIRKMNIIFNCK